MTFLMVVLVLNKAGSDHPDAQLLAGDGYGLYLFFVTFSTSALSAGLGLAKCLKVGPCRVLAEGGCLGGLLAPRFLLIFAACLLSLVGKGLALASPFLIYSFPSKHYLPVLATIFA